MEVKQPHIKSIPYAEFKDNDTLEQIMNELHEGGVNVVVGSLLEGGSTANTLPARLFPKERTEPDCRVRTAER